MTAVNYALKAKYAFYSTLIFFLVANPETFKMTQRVFGWLTLIADDGGLHLSGRMLPQPTLEQRDGTHLRLDDVAGSGFVVVAIGPDAQALAASIDAFAIGLGALPRIAIVPQKINLEPSLHEGIVEGRDLDNHFGEIATRAKNVLVLMRPDRYVALAMRVEKAQTPKTFVEMARGLLAMMK